MASSALNMFYSPSGLEWLYLLRKRRCRVRFCWVPVRVAVHGNGKADRLAGEEGSQFMFRNVFPLIRVAVVASWQQRWETRVAAPKMGQVTKSVSLQWKYTHFRDRSSQTL